MGTPEWLRVGAAVYHRVLGNCTVRRIFPRSGACWIDLWGGPDGNKLLLFRGQRIADLGPRPPLARRDAT